MLLLLTIIGVLALLDVVTFYGVGLMVNETHRKKFKKFYLSISIGLLLAGIVAILLIGSPEQDYIKFRYISFVSTGVMLFYIPRLIFLLFVLLAFIVKFVFKLKPNVVIWAGITCAGLMFIAVLHGITLGKYHFVVKQSDIVSADLPKSFDGYRIAYFSDAHLGSFTAAKYVAKGVKVIQDQHPDIILFTGDFVNMLAAEAEPYIPIFQKLHAPYGKYAILGNHDMNDYRNSTHVKNGWANTEKIAAILRKMGFIVLRNEHVFLHKGNDSIALLGTDYWGKPPFHKYGDLQKALKGAENMKFKMLITHDPSHWDLEVEPKTNIQLTMTGHTHGMQFGIDWLGIKWSMVQYKYPHWKGLYKKGNQFLYVNPGFGHIGFLGRVGIWPEITVLTLKSK